MRYHVPMDELEVLARIVASPNVLAGKPVIRGTRLSVEHILNLLANGDTVQEILGEYDGLTEADIQACLLFARKAIEDTSFMPLIAEAS
jgi:uncharacterized protein (DUF433 family)